MLAPLLGQFQVCRMSFSLRANKHTCNYAYMHTLQAEAGGLPSLAMAPPPPGYRLLQPQDVSVGKAVLYISRDPSTPQIHTQIIDITINGDNIKLKHKSEAPMTRVFVADKAAVGVEETGLVQAAVGAEVRGLVKAAVGAEATGADGSAGVSGEAAAEVDKFLRDEVVAWMSTLEAVGSSLPEALDAALAALEKTPEGLVQAFKVKVPWQPCVDCQAVPNCSKKAPCTF